MLRFLIADDYIHTRLGLKEILLSEFIPIYIEEAADADTLICKALSSEWDFIITDLNMPGKSGLDAVKEILEKKPLLSILLISLHAEEQYVREALLCGAKGFLEKNALPDELADTVRKILNNS